MDAGSTRAAGWLATAVGVVLLFSVASLAVFFAIAGPFGALNDWSIGLGGILAGLLAWAAGRRRWIEPAGLGLAAELVGVAGAAIVVIGAGLVISKTTGFMLAGLVESVGFALIGAWLIVLNRAGASTSAWPQRLRTLGLVAGILMAVGIIAAPGVAMGLDDMDTAPAWVWISFIGWLGIFFAYPIWGIWLGRVTRQG